MKEVVKRLLPDAVIRWLKRLRARQRLGSARIAANKVGQVDAQWRRRIDDVVACPDNQHIPRCEGAGELDGNLITMHNGVRVSAVGYYGGGNLNMLIENRGVHEPQEERAFEEIIRMLPEECSMLELGAYWGFYSLSLLKQRPQAKCYLVEPDAENILSGQYNFRMNGRTGQFTEAWVGAEFRMKPPTIAVDAFCTEHDITHLHILHADIQGAELDMLLGASKMLNAGKVDFVFISTHSNKLHASCLERLEEYGYVTLAEVDLDATYSFDGLIVAKHPSVAQPEQLEISRRGG
ncbi:MAG: FkbM family methyltransferase [Puniceicoccaceae bacterium]